MWRTPENGLWSWAAVLCVLLVATLPLAIEWQVVAALAITVVGLMAWRRSVRVASERGAAQPSAAASLPASTYRHPVVLVAGDCLAELFGPAPAEQWLPRVTVAGCYLPVPDLLKLPATVTELVQQRPEWHGQLSVMYCIAPHTHTDAAVLANQLRSVCDQIAMLRKRGMPLSLLVAGYFRGAAQVSPWFSWEAGEANAWVREPGACMGLAQWQGRGNTPAAQAARLRAVVQLNAAAGWLREVCVPEMRAFTALAVVLVPGLGQHFENSLWQQWLRKRTGLDFSHGTTNGAEAPLPFPDPLLHLLPGRTSCGRRRRVVLMGIWLFVLTACVALLSSAWQNTLLVRQVTDDLRRYGTAPVGSEPNAVRQRENALAVLHQDAQRLDTYYRQGAPWSLGLGLYQGEKLRPPLLAAINGHRLPTMPASPDRPRMVRLDSLSLFGSGSAQLKPGSTKVLVSALAGIKAQPGWLIVITGHTDATGSVEHNLRLSRARAAAVHDWIQHMGDIPATCFAVQGVGASQPVASNDTEHGRSANRRVEIRLVPAVGACQPSAAAPGLQPLSYVATFNAN
ncbi:OmpA family protein [Pantoea sp. Tr-811]|uniref:OmpA family protein n=1 Tax=Pantoea sp. Tr-811 TaxID=2608361 RepID=UPI0014224073|nr:OmpA family protein [Pantoea sp. Tr-811]NIF25131.1 OmpA family protein [Pantoea sp. Tr-811]